MTPDMLARLRQVMRGEIEPKGAVTGVEGVTTSSGYAFKPLELRRLQRLRLKNHEMGKDVFQGVTKGVFAPLELDQAGIDEREGMAADSVPAVYLNDWARLQCQKPARESTSEWRQAINDAGLFLDQWGNEAEASGWTVADLFNAPRNGVRGGLIWWLAGERVRALGAEGAVTVRGRAYER